MKHLLVVTAACIGVALAVLLLSWTTFFSQIDYGAHDFTLRVVGEVKPSSPTTIVAIDEDSLSREGAWPWSREKLAHLIDRIQAGTPRAIAIDVVLDDKAPREADDNALAATIARTPKLVLATRLSPDAGTHRWLKPNPMFLQPHVRLGHVQSDPDLDAIARHVWSALFDDSHVVMSAFSVEALHAAGFTPKGPFERQVDGSTVRFPQSMEIRFIGGRGSFPQLSAANVLNGQVDPGEFRDRIVLIGRTAFGDDQWFTPFSTQDKEKTSGVEIHANAIETFYAGNSISEASQLTVFLSLVLVAMFVRWLNLNRRFEGVRFYALSGLMLPGAFALSWALMKYGDTWFPFLPAWLTIVASVIGLQVIEMFRVNTDLDRKLAQLSVWDEMFRHRDLEMDDRRGDELKRLIGASYRNARWRLQAVDFFNEDLVRFLSFNRAILASIEDVIIVADAAGRVVYQNPAAHKLDGYSSEPLPASDYLSALLDGRSFDGNPSNLTLARSRDGKRFFNVTFAPISTSGVVISLHDATAQHELNQAKNDMVSLVSHELRTPLTSIRGYSDMLMKYDLVAAKGKPFLSTIIEESRRLNSLIQSFLDVAYIESGRQQLTVTEFEIGPVLRDMAGVLTPVAAEKEIRIETPENAEPARVRADRLLLYQALSNLVTNAIKYSPSGTTVRLNLSNGDGKVRFQIADEGFGIPPEDTSRIFEKFYRRANKETREQSGFGLGLAFVKEVAVKHGGDVYVESEVGKGSRFTFWIPN